MMETITTNGASILTIIALWSTLTWLVTYMYMSERVRRIQVIVELLQFEIDENEREFGHVLDDYIQHHYSDGEWIRL